MTTTDDSKQAAATHVRVPTTRQRLWEDRFFWIAVILCLSIQAIPETRWMLWPLKQFGVYTHELFHGLSALVAGGSFQTMMLHADGGGLALVGTYSSVASAFVSAGGLLGPSILGAVILFFSRRFRLTRYLLRALAALMLVSAMFWVRDGYTAVFAGVSASLLAGVSLFPWITVVRIFAQYLGVQLCLENVLDLDYMFTESFTRDGKQVLSDTGNMASVLGGSYILWACIIAVITLVIVAVSILKSRPPRNA